jgi:hypothetical protein
MHRALVSIVSESPAHKEIQLRPLPALHRALVSIVSESSAQRLETLSTLLTAQLCYHVIMLYACKTSQPNIVKHWKLTSLGTF